MSSHKDVSFRGKVFPSRGFIRQLGWHQTRESIHFMKNPSKSTFVRLKTKRKMISAGGVVAALLAATIPAIPAGAEEPALVAGPAVLNDSMSRTVSPGWGQSPENVTYSSTSPATSVSSGRANIDLSQRGGSVTTAAAVSVTDAEAAYTVAVRDVPTSGSGVYSSLHLRHTAGGFYRTSLRVAPGGKATLELSRSNSATGISVLQSAKTLPFLVRAGQAINVKFQTAGSADVRLKSKAWPAGSTEPSTWTNVYADTSGARITTAGKAAVSGYLATTSQPTVLAFDNLRVSPLATQGAVAPAPATSANLPGWGEPDFRDEFSSGTQQWNVRDNESLSYDVARIKAANVTVSGGLLHITGKRETVGDRDFTTGYLDSIGKYEQQFGRWEMRAKIPTTPGDSRGIWPAFWLRNSGVGELDIMEAWGDPFTNPTRIGTSTLTIHESTNGTGASKGWNWEALAGTTVNSSADFHTWAVEYTPTELKGFFDGKQVLTATKAQYPWLWGPNFQSAFNMRLNLHIGSPYHGYPIGPDYTDTKMPADYQIDYVRAWKY